MNAFDQARSVESEAFVRLRPFIEEHADSGQFVVTDKGRLAPFLQEVIGDVLLNKGGRIWSLELKAERRHTGNLFLETWSNRNLDDAVSHATRGSNPGWLLKTRSDLLMYYFIGEDILYVLSGIALKRWAFGCGNDSGRIYDFPELKQKKYQQANDTWGRLVSVDVLMREMDPPPKRLSVAQLSLKFSDAAE